MYRKFNKLHLHLQNMPLSGLLCRSQIPERLGFDAAEGMSIMTDLQGLVEGLQSGDSKYAYQCLKRLESKSRSSNIIYPFLETFAEMLEDPNSYIRTRALLLIAANARWDEENKIAQIIDRYLKHIHDEKPITARQCIRALPLIARHKPDLKAGIVSALRKANLSGYPESMRPLLLKDLQKALREIGIADG